MRNCFVPPYLLARIALSRPDADWLDQMLAHDDDVRLRRAMAPRPGVATGDQAIFVRRDALEILRARA